MIGKCFKGNHAFADLIYGEKDSISVAQKWFLLLKAY